MTRLRQCGEMADRPRNDIAVAVQIARALAGGSEDARDVPRDGRLFGQHGNIARFRSCHLRFQFIGTAVQERSSLA